jgi:hypothetical protein
MKFSFFKTAVGLGAIASSVQGQFFGNDRFGNNNLIGANNHLFGNNIGNNQPNFFHHVNPKVFDDGSAKIFTASNPSAIDNGGFKCVDGHCGHSVKEKPIGSLTEECVISGSTVYCK